jgi:putative addiction module component (TIGR02574 family)
MPVTMTSLGLDKLSREDRLALVQELWDSIAAERGPSLLTDAQREELRRRVAEDDANPDDVIPWEQVKAEARSGIKS